MPNPNIHERLKRSLTLVDKLSGLIMEAASNLTDEEYEALLNGMEIYIISLQIEAKVKRGGN